LTVETASSLPGGRHHGAEDSVGAGAGYTFAVRYTGGDGSAAVTLAEKEKMGPKKAAAYAKRCGADQRFAAAQGQGGHWVQVSRAASPSQPLLFR
jgi:hypothetical protein